MLPRMDPQQQLAHVAAAMISDRLIADGADQIEIDPPAAGATAFNLRIDDRAATVAVTPLFDLLADGDTLTRKAALEERLHAYGARDVALWTPPGASLPDDPDSAAATVAAAARALEFDDDPRRRCAVGEVAFTVDIGIRKTDDEGSYMSVLGGLSQQWARFTNQVMGQYQLDANEIHRLPADDDKVTQMVDFLVLVANGIRKPGTSNTIRSEDTWSFQRLRGLEAPIVIAAAPTDAPDGRAVRRHLRRGLRDAAAELPPQGGRIAAAVGLVPQLKDELASIALRGIDPTLLAGWDAITLLADARTKPLLG